MPFTVFFDLDGTLTNPARGITGCINHALAGLGQPMREEKDLLWCIGPPLLGSFGVLLASDDPSLGQRALDLYRERFTDVGLFENEVYDGIPEALAQLSRLGLRLAVATSKPEIYAKRILNHLQLTSYFEECYGSGLDGSLSDKGELLQHAIDILRVIPAHCLMVGDRKHDVLGAIAAGIPCLGVLYGYGSEEELRLSGATALCNDPRDLVVDVSNLAQMKTGNS